jgi:hypothetical protein
MVLLLRGTRSISLLKKFQTACATHSASYPVDTGKTFPGIKRTGREAHYHFDQVPRLIMRGATPPPLFGLHGVVLR